jgi:hypothetical protein
LVSDDTVRSKGSIQDAVGGEAIEKLIEIARRNSYKREENQPLQGFIYAIAPSNWAK